MTLEEKIKKVKELIDDIIEEFKTPIKTNTTHFNTEEAFTTIWKKYPSNRRDNKPKCWKIFKETVKNQEDFSKITKALEHYLGCNEDVQRGFIKLSSTWFGQGWEMWWENSEETPSNIGLNKHLRTQ